jgi:Flp pilus assembly protein TadD
VIGYGGRLVQAGAGIVPAHIRSGRRRLAAGRGAAVAVLLTLLGSGCQTASIDDAMDLTRDAATSGDISDRDLRAGKAHFQDGNFGLAEKHFRKAVELRATNAEAWLGLAASYDQLGRFDFADRAYENLIKLVGRQPRVVNNMGYSHYLRGDPGKARELLQEARKGLPGDAVVEANLALLDRR